MEFVDKKGKKHFSLKEFEIDDRRRIGIFQGSRGENPDLDIIVKYQENNKRVRTPKHLHWAIDLLVKKEHEKELTKKFIKYLLDMWEKVEPFKTKEEQKKCKLKFSTSEKLAQFEELNNYGEYTVEFIGAILELIMVQEKTGCVKAHMFKGVLEAIYNNMDYFSIVSRAGYTGR